MLGALGSVASNKTLTHVQDAMQTLSIAKIFPFRLFKLLYDFPTRKQLYNFYSQTETIFS